MAYFPEPEIRDPTWGAFGEDQVDWLRRSTLARAASIRAALNENLGHIPEPWAGRLARRLVTAWRSSYFELIVGRVLQELGADVTPEPIGTNGTRIDHLARFPDGAVTVEAVSKVYNPGADAARRRKGAVVERIRPMIPAGWSLLAGDVPERWSNELEAVVRDWLVTLGPGRRSQSGAEPHGRRSWNRSDRSRARRRRADPGWPCCWICE